jgi:hypothetical protein
LLDPAATALDSTLEAAVVLAAAALFNFFEDAEVTEVVVTDCTAATDCADGTAAAGGTDTAAAALEL